MGNFAPENKFNLFSSDVPTLLYSDPGKGGDGSVNINSAKSLAKWQWIAATYQGTSPIVVPANKTVVANLNVGSLQGQGGDFEACAILMKETGRVAVQPYCNTGVVNRFLSNQPVSMRLLSGTAQLPGILPQSIYCLPKTNWQFTMQDLSGLSNSVTAVVFGRRFLDRQNLRAERANHLNLMHPYWIGPQDPSNASSSGPEVTLAPNSRVTLTFPIPSSADFLCRWILDDSTAVGGAEPKLYAQISENYTRRGLVDMSLSTVSTSTNLGIQWRDFLACPSVVVSGMPGLRAFSLGGPRGGWTHLIPRNTQITVEFTSLDSNTITLRPAFHGWLIYGKEPDNRRMSADWDAIQEREAQASRILTRSRS